MTTGKGQWCAHQDNPCNSTMLAMHGDTCSAENDTTSQVTRGSESGQQLGHTSMGLATYSPLKSDWMHTSQTLKAQLPQNCHWQPVQRPLFQSSQGHARETGAVNVGRPSLPLHIKLHHPAPPLTLPGADVKTNLLDGPVETSITTTSRAEKPIGVDSTCGRSTSPFETEDQHLQSSS